MLVMPWLQTKAAPARSQLCRQEVRGSGERECQLLTSRGHRQGCGAARLAGGDSLSCVRPKGMLSSSAEKFPRLQTAEARTLGCFPPLRGSLQLSHYLTDATQGPGRRKVPTTRSAPAVSLCHLLVVFLPVKIMSLPTILIK